MGGPTLFGKAKATPTLKVDKVKLSARIINGPREPDTLAIKIAIATSFSTVLLNRPVVVSGMARTGNQHKAARAVM